MICQSAFHPLSGSIPILLINLFLSLIDFNFSFSSGERPFGIEDLFIFVAAFFGRSLMCPTLDSTIYSLPKYFEIVLAFAGDSTITSDLAIIKISFLFYEYH